MGYEPCVTTLVTVEEYCCSFNVKKHVFFLNIEVMDECPFFFSQFGFWLSGTVGWPVMSSHC